MGKHEIDVSCNHNNKVNVGGFTLDLPSGKVKLFVLSSLFLKPDNG